MNSFKIDQLLLEIKQLKDSHGPHDKKLADALNVLGLNYYFSSSDCDKALGCHREALRILVSYKTQESQLLAIAATLSDIGNCFLQKGEDLKARRTLLQAIKILSIINENNPKTEMLHYSLQNRLSLFSQSEKFDQDSRDSMSYQSFSF